MSTLLDPPEAPTEPVVSALPRLRVRTSRVVAVGVVAVALGAAAWWLLSWWSPVPVREVVVAGASADTAEEIESVAGIDIGVALRGVDIEGATQRVGQLQGIDGVDLELQRPWTVVISVAERFPFAVVRTDDRWTVLDRDGQPIREEAQQPNRLPEVVGPAEQHPAIFATIAALDEQLRTRIRLASQDEQGSVQLTLKGGSVVEWGRPEANAEKARVLRGLLPLRASRYSVAVPQRPAVSPDARLGQGQEQYRDQEPFGAPAEPTEAVDPGTAATPDLE